MAYPRFSLDKNERVIMTSDVDPEVDAEVVELIARLLRMQEKAELLAECQNELREQLRVAELAARELHLRIMEDKNDLGGEG